MLTVQNPGTLCTCVSPHQSVPESAIRHPSPGLHTSHRLKTSDNGARQSTREQGRHLSTEGAVILCLAPPQRHLSANCASLTESLRFSTPWGDVHFTQWEKRENWWLYNTCACTRPARRRPISVETLVRLWRSIWLSWLLWKLLSCRGRSLWLTGRHIFQHMTSRSTCINHISYTEI